MNQGNPKSFYFPHLDGFRFLAFCLVFLNHAFIVGEAEWSFSGFLKEAFLRNGASGVSFFFVLSGFLITHHILTKEADANFSLKNFYIRRAIRIWPLYFLCLIYTFIVAILPFQNTMLRTEAFHWNYWVFLSNFHLVEKIHQGIPIILPLDITWSISIEEQFYLLWPLLFLIIKPFIARVVVMVFLIIFSLCFRIYFIEDHAVHYFHSFSALYELSLGGLLALASIHLEPNEIQTLDTIYIKGIYFIGLVWVFMNGEQFLMKDGRFLQPLFFSFVIYEQCFCKQSFYKLGNYKIISGLGKYTYGMYLLHPLSLWGTQFLFLKMNAYHEIVIAFIAFLVTTLTSVAVYHLFEQKILLLKRHFQ